MSSLHKKAIVIEDDEQIKDYIRFLLQKEGIETVAFAAGLDGVDALDREEADIVLLDLSLPDTDGLDILQRIRARFDIPIIVVSAREQIGDKVIALDLGADDYLTKPFSGAELTARVRVALRRNRSGTQASDPQIVSVDALSIDLEKRLVLLDGRILHLTPMEYDLLALFFM
ncbi:MAG: response regulator transcription factor, partial [Clostridiales Family XIII bacterium]|nr:response regulator transcription factor [Clostridiales Family XIII bacterium]